MKILFLAELIITVIISVVFIKNVRQPKEETMTEESLQEDKTQENTGDKKSDKKKGKEKENSDKSNNKSGFYVFSQVFTVAMIIIGLADITNLAKFEQLHGAFATMGGLLAFERVLGFIRSRKTSRTLEFLSKAFVIVVALELTVFQFPSYRTFFGNYVQRELSIPDAVLFTKGENGEEDKEEEYGKDVINVDSKDTISLIFKDINMKTATIKIDISDASEELRNKLSVNIDAKDDSYAHYFRESIIKMESYVDNERSQYTTVLLSGKTKELKFNFKQLYGDRYYTISKIELNVPIPFHISLIRLFALTIISTLVYAIVFSTFLRKSYSENKKFCFASSMAIMGLAVFLAVLAIVVKIPEYEKEDYFKQEKGNQVSEELVLAFESGQVSLLHEPTPELYEIENPYDRGLRESTDIKDSFLSIWDHVLYKDKLYSYYGIAPVIMLFLPYHKITGYFFPTNIAVMIFAIIGIVFLTLTYSAVIKQWFSRIPSGCYLAGLIIVIAACGIWYSIGRTLFYEISISSGFAFVTMGAYFLISSNVIGSGKTSLIKIPFASLFLAIAVLCRPTLAVYAVCACVYYLIGLKKSAQVPDPVADDGIRIVKERKILYIIGALLPFIILGSVQMWYNYVRFESPFDFGIKYSLTINDFVHAEYHTLFVIIGVVAYLFATPQFRLSYPYVSTYFDFLDANGFYFKDLGNTSGVVFLALPVLFYFLTGKALKKLPNRKSRLKAITIVGLPCVIMPFIILFSIWESGYAVRYTADFSWEIITGALAIAFFLYLNSKNETTKKFFRMFMAFSMVWSIMINLAQTFSFIFNSHDYYPSIIASFKQLVEFWN